MKKVLFVFIILITSQVIQVKSQTYGWTQLISGSYASLFSVYFTSADTGYAVGDCVILKTTDGGMNWVPQTNGTTYTCPNSVNFINSNYGFVAGIWAILKTTDGGNNWIPTIDSTHTDNLFSISFPSDSVGYIVGAVGGGKIYKTIDKGNTWFKIPGPYSSSFWSYGSVFFTSKDTGYIVSDHDIFKTTNGGINWTQQTSPTFNTLSLFYFITKDIGYIVGDNNTILKTTNGGTTWIQQTVNLPYNQLYSVCFTSPDTGYVVGGDPTLGGQTGVILKTIDGGVNWVPQTTPVNTVFYSVYFPVADTGYVVGWNGTILKTTNGGITVGTKNNYKEVSMNIYPNPFIISTQITLPQTYHSIALAVYDIQGKQVAQQQYTDCDKIQLSRNQLSNGLYFLKLTLDDKEVETGKIVISE